MTATDLAHAKFMNSPGLSFQAYYYSRFLADIADGTGCEHVITQP